MSLAGRRAAITGAARGLGAVSARGLAEVGCKVALLDIREELGRQIAGDIGASARFFACDVADADSVTNAFAEATQWLGGLDILIASAGLDRPGAAPQDISPEDWDLVMGANARGTYLTNRAAYFAMQAGGGRIVNFASYAGIRGYRDRAAYAAAKAAVLGWTRSAAQAWGQGGITVNALAPVMRTEVAEKYLATLSDEDRAAYAADLETRIPAGGRLGEPVEDLLPLILFLAGDGARYITGQTFAVDGGMTMLGS